jgi:prepilin-type processing-associated H-X9-DG protein
VPSFLCPSDLFATVSSDYGVSALGPANYAACIGTGGNLGSPFDTDGMFYAASRISTQHIADGLTNTVAMSECRLGIGPEQYSGSIPGDPQGVYAFISGPVSDSACAAATLWNTTNNKGFLWLVGELRVSSYNHYYGPNAPLPDCIGYDPNSGYATTGWHAARSKHPGGVNAMLGDGSVRFINSSIDLGTWRKLATRAGREIIGDF